VQLQFSADISLHIVIICHRVPLYHRPRVTLEFGSLMELIDTRSISVIFGDLETRVVLIERQDAKDPFIPADILSYHLTYNYQILHGNTRGGTCLLAVCQAFIPPRRNLSASKLLDILRTYMTTIFDLAVNGGQPRYCVSYASRGLAATAELRSC